MTQEPTSASYQPARRPRKQPWGLAAQLEALRISDEHGPSEAARRMGIPRQTVQHWVVNRDALVSTAPGKPAEAEEPWSASDAAAAYRRTSDAARQLADRLIADGKAAEAAKAMIASAVACDKALLLAGQATSRTETSAVSVSATVGRINDLLARLPGRTIDAQASQKELD